MCASFGWGCKARGSLVLHEETARQAQNHRPNRGAFKAWGHRRKRRRRNDEDDEEEEKQNRETRFLMGIVRKKGSRKV